MVDIFIISTCLGILLKIIYLHMQKLPERVAIPVPTMNPEFVPLLVSGLTAALALDKVWIMLLISLQIYTPDLYIRDESGQVQNFLKS